jgi:hypothetical protein
LLYLLWEFLDPGGVGYSCMFSYVNEGSLLRNQHVVSIFPCMDCGLLVHGKALQCCGELGEVAGGGVVIMCELYCIASLVLFVVVLVF